MKHNLRQIRDSPLFKISRIVVLTVGIAASSSAVSADDQYCSDVGKLARTIMAGRQAGTLLDDMLQIILPKMTSGARALGRRLVMDAYAINRQYTTSAKMAAVDDYQDRVQLECLEAQR